MAAVSRFIPLNVENPSTGSGHDPVAGWPRVCNRCHKRDPVVHRHLRDLTLVDRDRDDGERAGGGRTFAKERIAQRRAPRGRHRDTATKHVGRPVNQGEQRTVCADHSFHEVCRDHGRAHGNSSRGNHDDHRGGWARLITRSGCHADQDHSERCEPDGAHEAPPLRSTTNLCIHEAEHTQISMGRCPIRASGLVS